MRRNIFLSTLIISVGFHSVLLLGSSRDSKMKSDIVHFSQNSAQRIQVKRMVRVKNNQQLEPKKKVVKKARANKTITSKNVLTAKQEVMENAPEPMNLVNAGQINEKARYLKRIRDQILAKKRYPRIAKMLKKQGVVDVYFEVSYPKNLINIKIQKGSGHAILDKSALETIEGLEQLPKMPDFLKSEVLKIAIPIKYELL